MKQANTFKRGIYCRFLAIAIALFFMCIGITGKAYAITITIGAGAQSQSPMPAPIPNAQLGDTLTNGDFTITRSGVNTTLGNGVDEGTSWIFDFTGSSGWPSFANASVLNIFSANLFMNLTVGQTPRIDNDIIRVDEVGFGDINTPEIQGLTPGTTTTVSINMLDFYNKGTLLSAILQPLSDPGKLNMFYGDDAIINSALMVVSAEVPEPATLALLGLGIVGIGVVRRRVS